MAAKMRRISALLVSLMLVLGLFSALGSMCVYAEEPEGEPEYDMEGDRSMLPGWDMEVWESYDVRMPDGDIKSYDVKDVSIDSQTPDGANVVDLHPEDEHWCIDAHELGEAVIKVTYEDLEGKEKSYTFKITVATVVYDGDLYSEDGWYKGLPGREFNLAADVWKDSRKSEDEEEEHEDDPEGLVYSFEIVEGAEYADLIPADGGKAKLKFKDIDKIDDPQDWQCIKVKVTVTDAENKTLLEMDRDFMYSTVFFQIVPVGMNVDIDPGESEEQEFHLMNYMYDEDGAHEEQVPDNKVEFNFIYNDDDCIVKDDEGNVVGFDEDDEYRGKTDGGKYTITRLSREDFNLIAVARFTPLDSEEELEEEQWYHYNWKNYDIWFEDHDPDIWSEGETEIQLDMSEETKELLGKSERYYLDYSLGDWDDDDEWVELPNSDDFITVDPEDRSKVKVDGGKLAAAEFDDIFLRAFLKYSDDEGNILELTDNDCCLHIKGTELNYNFREDRDMVKGWDDQIDHFEQGWADMPDFEGDFSYEIVNVELVDPDDDRYVMIRKEYDNDDEESDDYWWKIKALRYGDADIKVTYKKWGGDPDYESEEKEYSYTYKISVVDSVYDAEIMSETDTGLPGDQLLLSADIRHAYIDEDGEYHEDYNDDIEGVSCDWTLVYGSDFASIDPDPKKPFQAVLTMGELPEDSGWEDIDVLLTVKQDGEEVASRNRGFHISDDYYDIWPKEHDEALTEGSSEDVTLELRHYYVGCTDDNGYDLVDDTGFRWYYEDDAVEVKDSEGKVIGNVDEEGNYNDSEASHGKQVKFTVERKGSWDTGAEVVAIFKNGDDEDDERQTEFWYREMNYDIWFNRYVDRVFDDQDDTVFTVNTQNVTDILEDDAYTIEYSVGEWDEDDNWVPLERDGLLTPDPEDKGKVALHGKKLIEYFDDEGGDFYLKADLMREGQDEPLHSVDIWLHSCHATEELAYPGYWERCVGWRVWIPAEINIRCENSEDPYGSEQHIAQVREVKIKEQIPDEEGKKVIADPAEELDDEGSIEYYRVDCLSNGEATVTVRYDKDDGGQDERDIFIRVSDSVYDMSVKAEGGSTMTLPGGSINLISKATVFENGDTSGHEPEGVYYHWEVFDGNEFVDIEPSSEDPKEATSALVSFHDFDEDQNHAEAWVRVILCTDLVDGEPAEGSVLCDADIRLEANNMYFTLEPAEMKNPDLKTPVKFTPQLKRYSVDEDPEVVKNVDFIWHYDEEDGALEITDENGEPVTDGMIYEGQTFTVARNTLDDARMNIEAVWYNQWGDEDRMDQDFYLEDIIDDYPVKIEPEDAVLIKTGKRTLTADLSAFEGLDVEVEFTATVKDDYRTVYLEKDKEYTVDGNKITLLGSEIAKKGDGPVTVYVIIFRGDYDITDARTVVQLKDKCDEHKLVKIDAVEATCTHPGNIEYWECSVCGKLFADDKAENEITEDETIIGKLMHVMDHHDLVKATAKKDGSIEYWQCRSCNGLFADEFGGVEIKPEDTVIPKNDITVKAKKLTAKASKNTVFKAKKAFKVKNAKGKVTYKKLKGDKKIKVAKNGKVTVKKGLKAGKTYKVKVKVTSAATDLYAKYTKKVTLKIKIKK